MSVLKSSQAGRSYQAIHVAPPSFTRWEWAVTDALYRTVDIYRTRSSAENAARMLNSGTAHVEPHALVGCRVVIG
jgi:hypothetical protein